MNKAIVIGTYLGREAWTRDLLASLNEYDENPIITVTVPWELNVIRWVYEQTTIDEFLFLQDSVVVKDYQWIHDLFAHDGSVSLSTRTYFAYCGKYQRSILNHMDLWGWPEVKNKRQAVTNEGEWTSKYVQFAGGSVKELWDDWDKASHFEMRHGRNNAVQENPHAIKYVGTWDISQIPNE